MLRRVPRVYLTGDFTADNLNFTVQYLQGKGVRLHWEERQSQVQNRGHIATSEMDYRWSPKEDSNRHPLSRYSHSSDPRFNGQKEREEQQRLKKLLGQPEVVDAATVIGYRLRKVWSETPIPKPHAFKR